MFKSIFERMFLTSILIITLVLTFATAAVGIVINHFSLSEKYESVIRVSRAIEDWTAMLEVENPSYYSHMAYSQTVSDWADFLDADIVITNTHGEVIYATNADITEINQKYMPSVNSDKHIRERARLNGIYKNPVYVVGLPIHYGGNNIGAMFFYLDLLPINRSVLMFGLFFLIVSIFGFTFAFRLVYRQARKISSPIVEINNAVLDISAGNFKKRIPVRSNDEIGQLSSAFNLMADLLQKLDNTRSAFVSDVSHELRTPMTSISGFIQGILDGTIPPEREKEYLKIVLDETKRLTKLVQDMLEMSKLESSEYKLNVSVFDINEFIRRCIIEMEQVISDKGLDIDVDFSKEVIKVCADADNIKRVFINLIDNALKFSYPNTTIKIKTQTGKSKVLVSVGNFGEGISEKDLKNIFNRFYKADKSRSINKYGAGLGLSFVKNIITLHNQNIWVKSTEAKPGSDVKYTEFTFTLELA